MCCSCGPVNSGVRCLWYEMKRDRKISGGLVAGLILLILCSACSSAKHPSDQALIENFQSHKSEFNQLLQMFLADKGLGRVAYDFTRPENPQTVGITRERLKVYRGLFDELDLSAGIEGYEEKDVVWFHASTYGLSVTGSGKGYAYLKERPKLVVDNLDTYWSQDGRSFTTFRHLEGNWYLYLDYED